MPRQAFKAKMNKHQIGVPSDLDGVAIAYCENNNIDLRVLMTNALIIELRRLMGEQTYSDELKEQRERIERNDLQ